MSLKPSSSCGASGVVYPCLTIRSARRRGCFVALICALAGQGCGPPGELFEAQRPRVGSQQGAASIAQTARLVDEARATAPRGAEPSAVEGPADVLGELALEAPLLVSLTNTIRCFRAPCFSNAVNAWLAFEYAARNVGSAPVTYAFPSGCQTVVRVLDPWGKVVKDAARTCPVDSAPTSWRLAPGESRTFTDRVELVGDDGAQLAGKHVLQVHLAPIDSGLPTAPAEASFEVELSDEHASSW